MEYQIIYGRHPVYEALKAGKRKIKKILVAKNSEGKIVAQIIALAKDKGIIIEFVEGKNLIGYSKNNQGIVAYISPKEYLSLDDLISSLKNKESATICILDEIEDPQNLGSIIRSAVCFGVDGIIVQEKTSAGISSGTVKASAGAVEYANIVKVVNISQVIEKLKENGFWIYGADMSGKLISKIELKGRVAVVIGSEGKGLRHLTKEKCDFLISIPITEKISSLNAAMSASIICYEIFRQKINI